MTEARLIHTEARREQRYFLWGKPGIYLSYLQIGSDIWLHKFTRIFLHDDNHFNNLSLISVYPVILLQADTVPQYAQISACCSGAYVQEYLPVHRLQPVLQK